MKRPLVALYRCISPLQPEAKNVVEEFGWSIEEASTADQLKRIVAANDVIAVLFQTNVLEKSFEEALTVILSIAPGARPIVCHSFSDQLDWPTLAAAGAFHALLYPINLREFRTSLGFVWAAADRDSLYERSANGPYLLSAARATTLCASAAA
jgi:DNA-binding NtrC family response regulator